MGYRFESILRPSVVLAVLAVSFSPRLEAQDHDLTLLVRRTYTTSAKIFPNPTARSSFIRNEHDVVEGLTGFSAELQLPFRDSDVSIALSAEYLSHVDEGVKTFFFGGTARSLPFRDGFAVIPVELRGIISIPVQSNIFRLTMAGGGGLYIADRILEVAGVGVSPVTSAIGYGITVSVSMEYRVLPGVWIHGETRFRDPDVSIEYTYDSQTAEYEGALIPLPTAPMHTRINVDGMSLAIGVMVEIPTVFYR